MNVAKELKVFAKDLSVLIVEDDILLNKQLVEIAKLFFKDVQYAYNGEDALQSYKTRASDIVVTDITMPRLNGIDMSKKIKYINSNQAIIIVSAHCHLDYVTEIVDLGIKQFIRKPFDDNELLYRLLKVSEEIVLLKSLQEQEIKIQAPIIKEQEKEQKEEESFSYSKKLSAESFMNVFEYDIQIEIEYLLSLSEDFERYVDLIYTNGLQEAYLVEVTSILKKMYTTISQMPPLLKMSYIFFDLASFLEAIDFQTLSTEQIQKLSVLEFIYEDINKFIQLVFVENAVQDVNYLEDSLSSSVEQLKQSVLNTHIEEEEFELF